MSHFGGAQEIVRFFIEDCGLAPNARNADSETCLTGKCYLLDSMRYMIEECHADIQAQDNQGRGLLHFTVEAGVLECLRYVVENCHCEVNAQDNEGRTHLHYVALDTHNICNLQLARYLAKQDGADLHAREQDGKRPLDLTEDPKLRDYLTQAMAN